MQLDMFKSEDIQKIEDHINRLTKSNQDVRKGLFARHQALEKRFCELEEMMKSQDREIYKLKQAWYGDEKSDIIVELNEKIS